MADNSTLTVARTAYAIDVLRGARKKKSARRVGIRVKSNIVINYYYLVD